MLPSHPGQLLLSSGFSAHRGLLLQEDSLLPGSALGSFPEQQRPCVSLDGSTSPSDCPVSLHFVSLPAAKESPATLRLSPAHIWPSPRGPIQLEAPQGPEPWPRPQLSSCCLGLSPSLMVHTHFVPVFPQNVASTPSPLPRARLQNAETMEAPSQISNRPAIKSP